MHNTSMLDRRGGGIGGLVVVPRTEARLGEGKMTTVQWGRFQSMYSTVLGMYVWILGS